MLIWKKTTQGGLGAVKLPSGGSLSLDGAARIVFSGSGVCVLLARGPVLLNGRTCLSCAVLHARDEVRAGGNVCYVAGAAPQAVDFTPGAKPVCCARCKSVLAAGERVVLCPACRAAHHEPCWAYAPPCAGCGRVLAGPPWRPEE